MSYRILHLDFHRGWGGQPSRIVMSSRELARRGHVVALAAPGDGLLAHRAREAGLVVYGDAAFYKPRRVISFMKDVRTIRKAVKDFRPDILHSHGSQDTWTAAIANRFGGPRLPHMMTRHNSKRVACSVANRWLYGTALDRLVVVSAGVLERYTEFFARGILDPEEIRIIPSSIDFARYDRPLESRRIREELGAAQGVPLIGAVGRLVRDKGQHVLLRAFQDVLGPHPRARLLLVGTGTEERPLRSLAQELGISDSVSFLGFREDVPDITAALDVSVLASIDCDASPAAVKEAMYLERPVVVTDIGGLREMVQDGVTGRIVPPENPSALAQAIVAALEGGETGKEMGRRAREVVRTRYSLEALADAYERAYASMIARRRSRDLM